MLPECKACNINKFVFCEYVGSTEQSEKDYFHWINNLSGRHLWNQLGKVVCLMTVLSTS